MLVTNFKILGFFSALKKDTLLSVYFSPIPFLSDCGNGQWYLLNKVVLFFSFLSLKDICKTTRLRLLCFCWDLCSLLHYVYMCLCICIVEFTLRHETFLNDQLK